MEKRLSPGITRLGHGVQRLGNVLDGHTLSVQSIAISPNGRILASASLDNTARLWNLDTNQPISSPLLHAHFVNSVSFSADGKLLATGCHDDNAYTWDVSAIVKEAGLDELLLDQRDKSLLTADATRRPVRPFDFSGDATPRPVRQPIKVPQRRVPQGFFDGLPDRAPDSAPHRLHPQSRASHVSTLSGKFSSLFRRPDAHNTSSRPRVFHWIRNRLTARPSTSADIELHERPSAVVDVPYCQAKRRDASAREKRRPTTRPTKRRILYNATAGSSRPPNNTVTQQSSSAAQAQSSSQPHPAVSTSTTPPVVANTNSTTNPNVTIIHAGRWTRFWLFICCASTEYTDGHH
ncbi:hypothetical protein EV702DRAFT_180824 [Suillus placidus]|uniref:Uncharacterized protein n=1 Tax=Suillus placidus TaxID=48579 RepID=A0A9P6ZX71_9AGAM|nr:hypothetical protein EV702DRAFT_180824 [Suillus placidus]